MRANETCMQASKKYENAKRKSRPYIFRFCHLHAPTGYKIRICNIKGYLYFNKLFNTIAYHFSVNQVGTYSVSNINVISDWVHIKIRYIVLSMVICVNFYACCHDSEKKIFYFRFYSCHEICLEK